MEAEHAARPSEAGPSWILALYGPLGRTVLQGIKPWPFSIGLGFDQAELIEGHQRLLVCGGQDAVDADGNPQHLLGVSQLPGQLLVMLEATAVD